MIDRTLPSIPLPVSRKRQPLTACQQSVWLVSPSATPCPSPNNVSGMLAKDFPPRPAHAAHYGRATSGPCRDTDPPSCMACWPSPWRHLCSIFSLYIAASCFWYMTQSVSQCLFLDSLFVSPPPIHLTIRHPGVLKETLCISSCYTTAGQLRLFFSVFCTRDTLFLMPQ